MNIWSNAVMTNAGLALLAKLVAGTTLTITKAQTGSGTVATSQLPSQTSVTNPQQTLTFRSVTTPEEGTAALTCYLQNDSLTTAYTATQVGIYAQDPDDGEILFFIAQAASGTGVAVPSNSEMPGYTAEWTFYFAYGQADSVSVTVSPANTVSQAQAQQMISAAVNAINAGTQITAGVLPVARGGTGNSSVDSTPTNGSSKMVTSGGVYTALNSINAGSQITAGVLPVARGGTGQSSVDSTPTNGSSKMVTSDGIFDALANKQNKITYGTAAPSGGSNGDIYIQYS